MTPTKQYNLNLLAEAAKNASEQFSNLLVLPEMYLTGYNYNLIYPGVLSLAEVQYGPSYTQVQSIAVQYNISILFTWPELPYDGATFIYDSAALIYRDGTTLLKYRKVNIDGHEHDDFGIYPGKVI